MKPLLKPRPKRIPLSTRVTSTLIRAPLFILGTVACGSASLAASLADPSGSRQHRVAQAWARFSLRVAGAPLLIVSIENLPQEHAAVYACNHLSYMDTPALFASLPFQFRIVARHDLWTIPFVGWHLRRSGQIPVNVENPRASVASLSGGVKTLKTGMPLVIFPEGGRTKTGEPESFLNGPAFMAIRAGVPLIPMALIGTHELLPIGSGVLFPSPVKLAVGEPISTVGLTARSADNLTAELHSRISTLYFAHSWRSQPAPLPIYDGEVS